jgi:transcriptional regulator with XRE-family HTH domain
VAHVAHKFEHLLQTYRCPDGREWSGAELAKATGGVVPRSYVTNLRKGRIESPGYEKLSAIARAMGFPPEVWFEEDLGLRGEVPAELQALGVLAEEDVEGIRSGRIADPSISQIAALAAAFGVPPSYLLDRGRELSVLDEQVLEALADERASAILRESARLSEQEKEIILGIVRQFGSQIDDA